MCERTALTSRAISTSPRIDSSLLWDAIRVLTRLIEQVRGDLGVKVSCFSSHTRRAKRRMVAVLNGKNKAQRKAAYQDLLKMAGNVLDYAHTTLTIIRTGTSDPGSFPLYTSIEHSREALRT